MIGELKQNSLGKRTLTRKLLSNLKMKVLLGLLILLESVCIVRTGCLFKDPYFTARPQMKIVAYGKAKVTWLGAVQHMWCVDQYQIWSTLLPKGKNVVKRSSYVNASTFEAEIKGNFNLLTCFLQSAN